MKPVIDKIYSNETKVPSPRRVPRQFHQVEIVINEHIKNKFSTQNNYPVKIKKSHNRREKYFYKLCIYFIVYLLFICF